MKLKHEFIEYVPEKLESGVLYISLKFRVITHLCCCGCGNEVVLSISPKGWNFRYNGESVSIDPSVGSWNLPCKSHYIIRNDEVQWAETYSEMKEREARKAENTKNETIGRESAPPKKKESKINFFQRLYKKRDLE